VVFSYLAMYYGDKVLGHSRGVCPAHIVAHGMHVYAVRHDVISNQNC